MAERERLDPEAGAPVSDAELAEIARHLRDVLGASGIGAATPAGANPGSTMLRFVASFVAPGLLLVAVMVARQMLG